MADGRVFDWYVSILGEWPPVMRQELSRRGIPISRELQALFPFGLQPADLLKRAIRAGVPIRDSVLWDNERNRPFFVGNRLIGPIKRADGTIAGFVGYNPRSSRKYLNTATPKDVLFGEHAVFSHNPKRLFLVEGYFDCIAGVARGLPVVAYCGSMPTREQIDRIPASVEEVVLVPDNDDAGIASSIRFLERVWPTERSRLVMDGTHWYCEPDRPWRLRLVQLPSDLDEALRDDERGTRQTLDRGVSPLAWLRRFQANEALIALTRRYPPKVLAA